MVIDVDLSIIDFSSMKNTLTEIARHEYMEMQDKKSKSSKMLSEQDENVQSIVAVININGAAITVHVEGNNNIMNDEMFASNINTKLQTLAPQYIQDEIYINQDLIANLAKDQIVNYVQTELGGALA